MVVSDDGEGRSFEAEGEGRAGFRCRTLGAGKLFFLSMASTVRWKRRKRAWARRRVEGRSMVFDNSLTVYSFS